MKIHPFSKTLVKKSIKGDTICARPHRHLQTYDDLHAIWLACWSMPWDPWSNIFLLWEICVLSSNKSEFKENIWAPPCGGVSGTSNQEETSGLTRDTLEGLYLSTGLGTPQDSPGRAGGSGWGEGCLGFSAEDVLHYDFDRFSLCVT